jgi:hypothetical protein
MAKFVCVILLVFILLVTTIVPEIYGHNVKSLYVAPRKENRNIHEFEAADAQSLVSDLTGVWKSHSLTGHNLRKRSAVSETNITTNVSCLILSRVVC